MFTAWYNYCYRQSILVDLIEIYWSVSFFLKEKIAKMLTRIKVTVMWTRLPVTIRTNTEFFVISIKVQQKSLRMAIETVCLYEKKELGNIHKFWQQSNELYNYWECPVNKSLNASIQTSGKMTFKQVIANRGKMLMWSFDSKGSSLSRDTK